jgi:RNA polymerase sigma factor (sigma-70 family)
MVADPVQLTPEQQDLAANHFRLAAWVLTRYFPNIGRQRDDALGESLLGIVAAAQRFDPSRGYAFKTYAVFLARARIHHYLAKQRRRGLTPHSAEPVAIASLDEQHGVERSTLKDFLPAVETDPDTNLAYSEAVAAFERLTQVQAQALRMLYVDGLDQTTAAKRMRCTRDAVRYYHQSGLKKLREMLAC